LNSSSITTARRANRAAIDARLKTLMPPPGTTPRPLYKTPPPYKLLTPEERAALVAAENARPKPLGCCGR
jgi:hypothetical protein